MSLTSVIRYVKVLDSTVTDGSGKTGLAFGDFTAKYLTQGGTLTSLTTETITTLGTYQAPTDAAHIRIKELSNANPSKGIYEVHFHDTQVSSIGKRLWLFLSASGAVDVSFELDLSDVSGRLPGALTAGGNMKTDVQAINAVSTSLVTTVNANQGTTQPVNFTGTAGSALAKVDVIDQAGVGVVNSDFTISAATSTTVTLPTAYTDTTALPDDSRYVGCVLQVVSGTGQGQFVILTTATGTPRQYNVFSGSMPVQLDSTSKCIVLHTTRARADLLNVTVGTNLDKGNYTLEPSSQATLVSTIASANWDLATSGHTTSGTFGAAMAAAGSAGDPWTTALPGSYGSGTAGNILGNRLDAAVTSRLAPTTSGRTLDITTNGNAGIDFGNIDNPTATVGLTGTTISSSQVIGSVTGNVGGNVSGNVAGNVQGNVVGSVNSVTSDVTVALDQAIPTSNTANTMGDCLNAARAQGFGKWVKSGTTLTLYAPNGSTIVRTFTLNDANTPTTRT